MRRWVTAHPFLAFYLLAVSLPTLLFTYLTVVEGLARMSGGADASVFMKFVQTREHLHAAWPLLTQHQDGLPKMLLLYSQVWLAAPFLFFPFAPTFSALLMLRLNHGLAAAKALLSLLSPTRGQIGRMEALRIYAMVLGSLAGIVMACWLYLIAWGTDEAQQQFVRGLGLHDLRHLLAGWVVALLLNQGGLLEELGWRGYAWPWLVRRIGDPLRAALWLGLAWAMWHSPRDVWMWATGQQSIAEIISWLAIFVPACMGTTLMAVYFVNRAGGSVLPAIMIHGASNYLAQGLTVTGNASVRSSVPPEWGMVWALAGLVTLMAAGRDLGWSHRLEAFRNTDRRDPADQWCTNPDNKH